MKIELVESTLVFTTLQLTKKNTHYISQKLITLLQLRIHR
jgi:hypothetical protein